MTTDRLIKDLPNYDAVFHIGDLSYANGFLAQWDQFTAQMEPIASKVPYMVARYVRSPSPSPEINRSRPESQFGSSSALQHVL